MSEQDLEDTEAKEAAEALASYAVCRQVFGPVQMSQTCTGRWKSYPGERQRHTKAAHAPEEDGKIDTMALFVWRDPASARPARETQRSPAATGGALPLNHVIVMVAPDAAGDPYWLGQIVETPTPGSKQVGYKYLERVPGVPGFFHLEVRAEARHITTKKLPRDERNDVVALNMPSRAPRPEDRVPAGVTAVWDVSEDDDARCRDVITMWGLRLEAAALEAAAAVLVVNQQGEPEEALPEKRKRQRAPDVDAAIAEAARGRKAPAPPPSRPEKPPPEPPGHAFDGTQLRSRLAAFEAGRKARVAELRHFFGLPPLVEDDDDT